MVDFSDLVVLAQNYGQAGKTFSPGHFDYSADGRIDFADLVILAHNYHLSLPAIDPPALTERLATRQRKPSSARPV